MADVVGEWVEIAERCTPDQRVFMRDDSDIPPSRGGRRLLVLRPGGTAELRAAGAADRRVTVAEGHWSSSGETLHAELDYLGGDYRIEQPDDSTMILRTAEGADRPDQPTS